MKIIVTPEASENVAAIVEYWKTRDYPHVFARDLRATYKRIALAPYQGTRVTSRDDVFYKRTKKTGHHVYYAVSDVIHILAVVHGARGVQPF